MFSHANKEELVSWNNRYVDISRLNYLHLDQGKQECVLDVALYYCVKITFSTWLFLVY